uniref:Uncharacterized protein n=1 Tax=Arundo donax TaxID=35708 RepID=A0A0A9F805_ARUDO
MTERNTSMSSSDTSSVHQSLGTDWWGRLVYPSLVYVYDQLTWDGGMRIFSTMESMQGCTIRLSLQPDILHAACSAAMESFQPWRTQESKKVSSFATRLPLATASVIRRKRAASIAGTRFAALMLMEMP